MQVVSNTPQTFLYGLDPKVTAASSRIQNDQIAKLVSERPDRFMGLATLPMQAPELAAQELEPRDAHARPARAARSAPTSTARTSTIASLEPFWAAADALGAFIMVHPTQVAGADRLKSYYLANLIGNPLDTTIATACLVFGGVIERHPAIRFFMVHGGGFAPYQCGPLGARLARARRAEGSRLAGARRMPINRLYFDTILHGQPALEFLVATFGASHVLLGSDYPYDMGTLECARQVRALSIPEADRATILGGRALELFGARR